MAFEIRHAPETQFDIADAYFEAMHEQFKRNEQAQRKDADLQLRRAGILAANDRTEATLNAAGARHAERLRFDREQADLKQLAAERKAQAEQGDTNAILDAYGNAFREPVDPENPDAVAADQLHEDLYGAADRPLVEHAPQGELDTPYGVKIPIVRPKSMAGARLLLDALNHNLDRKAKEQAAKQKASAAEMKTAADRQRAAQLQQMTGIGLPRPGTRRPATPEEGGYLLQDPTIEQPGDPGMTFDKPEDVLAVARLNAQREQMRAAQEQNRPATEEEINAAAETLLKTGRYKSATEARAAAEARLKYKLPVDLGGVQSNAGKLDFKLLLAKEGYERAEAVYQRQQTSPNDFSQEQIAAGQAGLNAALRAYAAEYARVHGADGNVPAELLPKPNPSQGAGSQLDRAALIRELEESL